VVTNGQYLFPVVYDVKNDPGEHVNLMVEYPNIKPGDYFQGYKK